jgi:hypothetical protein
MRLAFLLVIAHGSIALASPRLPPRVVTPPQNAACPLRWDELDAPARIPLDSRDCGDFDPASLLQPGACTIASDVPDEPNALRDCELGTMRGGTRAAVQSIGPSGSGHYWSVAIVLDRPGHPHACFEASTVGFRLLVPVAGQVPQVQWLADVDGNGERELILWERLPWNDYEVANALYPVVYVLDGTELVRRDDLAVGLRTGVARAYRNLLLVEPPSGEVTCVRAVADALEAR